MEPFAQPSFGTGSIRGALRRLIAALGQERLTTIAIAVVVVVAMAGVVSLERHSISNRQAEILLHRLDTLSQRLISLERKVQSDPQLVDVVRPEVDEVRDEMERTLDALVASGVGGKSPARVRAAAHRYAEDSAALLRLLEAGRLVEARQWDDAVVDVSHDALLAIVEEGTTAAAAGAQRAERVAKVGTVAVLIAVVTVVGWLLWKSNRVRRAADVAAGERRALARSEAHFRALVQRSHDVAFILATDGAIRYVSDSVERLLGYRREEVTGRSVMVLVHRDDAAATEARWDEIVGSPSASRRFEVRVRHRDGSWRWLEMVGTDHSHDPSIAGIVVNARDVTVRVEAEAAAREHDERRRELERRFRGAFDHAVIGMALVDLDGRLLQVNRSLVELVGYVEDDLLALGFNNLVHPDDEAIDFVEAARQLTAGSETFRGERRFVRRDGEHVWIREGIALVRDDDGDARYFVAQVQDITRTREAERLKDEFVSTVSHELRTPLTSISGYVDLLLDGVGGELSPKAEYCLGIVQQNGRRLVALVNDLLDISRIEAGRVELRRQVVDLPLQLRDVAASLEPQLAAKRQRLDLDLDDDLPAIWADPERIAQVFTNLLSNAHKYTPAGGTITVTAGRIGGAVRIDVGDTGIGLTPEEQERLFTKFFRAGSEAARKEAGTGLGLTITRALVALHGGTIAVESVAGAGSTFSVTLPLLPAEEAGAPFAAPAATRPTPPDAVARPDGGRILVVEDEPDVANLLRYHLESEGYDVAVAGTAEEAVSSVRAAPPDLVTLDLKLPDADGWSVLERLRAAGCAVPPVVVVSILPENGHGRTLGVVDYLAKPVRGAVLRDRVARALTTIERNGDGG